MKIISLYLTLLLVLLTGCQESKKSEKKTAPSQNMLPDEEVKDHKIIIYQMMTRLFGNTKNTNTEWGTLQQNGCGKFNDITDTALVALQEMGISHVWYAGILHHASLTEYRRYGILSDDPDVVKGRAGSPYAIKDYYDVDPDLAVDVRKRMQEFEALVARTHRHQLKVIIDFVPNHVARTYKSVNHPVGVFNLGEKDDKAQAFSPQNNFYYLPGKSFTPPQEWKIPNLENVVQDGKFKEFPAKATGNNVFHESPGVNDWYETVKLNYGVDYQNGEKKYFDPIPDTWNKMRDILIFWAEKKVDGFRCDMAEMVPVEFWNWVIPQVKKINRDIIFIAEIYNPAAYRTYLQEGKFSFLYDKVGLYDTLKAVIQNKAEASDISACWQNLNGINSNMLRFLENHDEQRIASPEFAGDARKGLPMMVVTATLNSGPVLVYFGQETGEPGAGKEGFGGNDGRTTIFDYWGVPEHQKWMNNGKFDGGQLSPEQKKLRDSYAKLLKVCHENEAIYQGKLLDLQPLNKQDDEYDGSKVYSYLRYSATQKLLITVNFDISPKTVRIRIPAGLWSRSGLMENTDYLLTDLLTGQQFTLKPRSGLEIQLDGFRGYILEFKQIL
jgi:glycosidase